MGSFFFNRERRKRSEFPYFFVTGKLGNSFFDDIFWIGIQEELAFASSFSRPREELEINIDAKTYSTPLCLQIRKVDCAISYGNPNLGYSISSGPQHWLIVLEGPILATPDVVGMVGNMTIVMEFWFESLVSYPERALENEHHFHETFP